MINAGLLQLVLDASNDGIVIAEKEGDENILIYANPAFQRLTGYSDDEILYQDCRFLQGDDRDQVSLSAIREAIINNKPCRQIVRNYRKDGTAFWNELSITPVFNEADQLTYYIGIQKDVSAQVEASERVLQLEAEIVKLKTKLRESKNTSSQRQKQKL